MIRLLREAAAPLDIALDDAQLARFDLYYQTLLDWNRRVNLTRITGPREVAIEHFLDSLSCLLVFPAPARRQHLRLIDVGTGAGFPGLALKIARPELEVTLLESVAKKTAFLKHVVAVLGVSGVNVVNDRAENLAHSAAHREQYDLAVARAVAPLAALAEYCLPFLRRHGRMIAQKTVGIGEELRAAHRAIVTLGGDDPVMREVPLPGLRVARLLLVVEKTGRTPNEFPRRSGLPTHQPL